MSELSRHQDASIGPYHLIKLIGVGPVSRVYVAERPEWPGRRVALKLFEAVPLHALEEKDEALNEVRLLACMEHPSILPMLDDGLHEDMLYLVTPYIKGDSLRQLLTAAAGSPLPLPEVLAMMQQIGEALQFAHTQNIVHANIKPENILVRDDGKVLLADFLLPSLVKSERAARILSTFAALYMAPEQFRGTATPLSDQYALACLTYELLTGQPPFEADDGMSLARQHATKEPRPPSQLLPTCEPRIEQALLKALVKRPAGRYPDIQAFLAELSTPSPLLALTARPEMVPVAVAPQALLPDPTIIEAEVLASEEVSSGVSEMETVKQPALKVMSAVVMTGIHEAVTMAVRGARPKPLTGLIPQIKPAPVLARAYPHAGTRPSRRQIWLIASLISLVLLASTAGLTIFFNAAQARQTSPRSQAHAGGTVPTSSTGQSSPDATSIAAISTPTATATPVKKPTPTATPTITPTATATPKPKVTATPTPTAAPKASLSCKVGYKLSSSWPGSFIASLTITNTGTTVIQNWTLVFTFPGDQQIYNGWNGHFAQHDAQVSVTDAGFNATLQPGSSATPGFQAFYRGENHAPTSFSLNGVACQ